MVKGFDMVLYRVGGLLGIGNKARRLGKFEVGCGLKVDKAF